MSSDPLVSIVIPVYNGANYVAEAIDSALAQTYPNIEVVVVDDGSTDGGATRRVLESYGGRIRPVLKPNGGVATALNAGIANMRGQFFSWLSHDDAYRPDKVARQVRTAQRFGQRCIVIGDFELMDSQGKTYHSASLAGNNLVARPLDSVFRGLINGCALLVPRDLFDEAGVFEPGLPTTQDYELWYRMARLVPFVHCPHSGVRQRVHELQGSRHASHLDEASRMFGHLVDSTPPRVMEAYDGSELRFLLRVRKALTSYPGLQKYLTYRIERLLPQRPYSVVVWGDGPAIPAAEIAQLRAMRFPPAEIVTLNVQQDGRVAGAISSAGANGAVSVTVPWGASIADIVTEAQRTQSTEMAVFLRIRGTVSETNVRAALEEFLIADADVIRPSNSTDVASELDWAVIRTSALGGFATALRDTRLDWAEASCSFQTATYALPEPPSAPAGGAIDDALRGKKRLWYDRSWSETAVSKRIAAMLDPNLPTVLFILHAVGGGTETHVEALARGIAGKANALCMHATSAGEFCLAATAGTPDRGLVFGLPEQMAEAARVLRAAGVSRVDVLHAYGFERQLEPFLEALGVPFDITLVDYHLFANNPFLCLDSGEFVGDDRLHDPAFNLVRRGRHPLLRKASRIFAISRDLAARAERLSPGLRVIPALRWDHKRVQVRHVFLPRIWGNEPLRVLISGNIEPHKGQGLVVDVAREIVARKLPVQLHLMGRMEVRAAARGDIEDALKVHGPFETGRFIETLSGIAPHIAWLPSQVPETWSYILSDFFEAALPVAATAIGAIPERCHGRPATWLLPVGATTKDWVDLFLRLHASGLDEPPRWAPLEHLPPAKEIYFEEYLYPGRLGDR
jgi:glycosyltransferase involved in cell wall biosynthesis